ncbi:CHC2 zinc finger domain-containing protein, partial [Faecalibaculum rodentium]
MPVFSEDTIRQVRARTDIVDVISQYVSLEKHGKEFKGICPFHDDHDPSMSVSPDKQIFKCFVCGAGGNVFSFLQKIEQITFPEAVTRAAAMAGIDLKLPQSTGVSPNQQAWNCLQSFTDYARYFLDSQEGEAAKEYCRKRKLSDEILETFEIGWAPGIQRQDRFFQGKGWGRDMLVKTGLLQAETGRPVFTDR